MVHSWSIHLVRDGLKQLKKDYEKTEDDLKALQSVGQIIGEVLRQLDDEKCMYQHTSCIIFEHFHICAHLFAYAL